MSSQAAEMHHIDGLLDKAERYMVMRNMTVTEAARAALPRDLLSIPLAELRDMVVDALADRLNNRATARRYRNTERTEALTRKCVQEATSMMSDAIARRAAILARTSYSYGGRRLSLLDMPLEAHTTLARDAKTNARTHAARASFHQKAIQELEKARVIRIADLPTQRIVDLALLAEEIWR